MAVRISWLINHIIGNEVADYVKEHMVHELKNLPSFKKGDYETCLKELYLKIDELI